jgi:hypothetical protein
VGITGSTITSTANVLHTAANQVFRSNTTVVALSITGNSTATNTAIGGTTFNVAANTTIAGSVHTITGNVNIDSGVLFVDQAANRVGINTTTPGFALDISGSTNISAAANVATTLGVGTNATIGGFANIAGAANVGTTLTVGTNATVGGFLNLTGTANVGGALRVTSTSNLVGSVTVGGNITVNTDYVVDVVANGDIGTSASPRLIYSFPKATYRTGKLMVQATNGGNNQIAEMVVAHDGTDAYVVVYGVVASPPASGGANTTAPLGTFTAAVNGSNVDITMAHLRNNSAVKVVAHLIK